jgi:hypothetical protein
MVVVLLCLLAGPSLTLATLWEAGPNPLVDGGYYIEPNWAAGNILGATIGQMHPEWHMKFMPPNFLGNSGKDFVEFHRELLNQANDARLYGFANVSGVYPPTGASIPVVAKPLSRLKFAHSERNGYIRPASDQIDVTPIVTQWTLRPALLLPRSVGGLAQLTAEDVGSDLDNLFHGDGHMSIARHDRTSPGSQWLGAMGNTTTAPLDGGFYQWHELINAIAHDWAVGRYQMPGDITIFFGVGGAGSSAAGAAGSSLKARRGATVYQGKIPIDPAVQYGASPRIESDIYVGDDNGSNLLYQSGIRVYDRNASVRAWDMDALSILNSLPTNGWYFSVTPPSPSLPGGGPNIYESAGAGANALFRTGPMLGLLAAASDNLDALEVDQERRIRATNDNPTPGIYDRPKQWFSLRSGTMFGLTALNCTTLVQTTVTQNDILQFNANGDLCIAVSGTTLGLVAADDLDALAIVDTAPLDVLSPADLIYYSLTPGSPGLAGGSPADILCKTVAGGACAGVPAAMLGLLATDDVDALDVRKAATGTGACCHSNGTCTQTAQAGCNLTGDLFSGLETVCGAAECPSAPGACCHLDGTCTSMSDRACVFAGGRFQGVGVLCTAVSCPVPPPNDTCEGAYQIPYDYPASYVPPNSYYEPPPEYRDNTYATSASYYPPSYYPLRTDYDPPYSCNDHDVFFPAYGSGTIWYYYDVPAGPGPYRSIGLTTRDTYKSYLQGGGYAYDTRLAVYYSPSGNCSTLNETACNDNNTISDNPPKPLDGRYADVRYYPPSPGRYYIQLASVGDVNRGKIKVNVYDAGQLFPPSIPTISQWGIIVLVLGMIGAALFLWRRIVHA